ncbi:Maestro heat-like repeat-containing protein family member 1 [Galemys pyrenaicus]|uniref:Maestro heat-like repeat-containing protein family member 1 n=1 Tax=Galemys pyrenaicus TaxID=202257 RepID=A0A8J6DP44_GALPY|nr:Maestro heat-like repeat-containing protein family member 1 [Galemys pyrenaicus]
MEAGGGAGPPRRATVGRTRAGAGSERVAPPTPVRGGAEGGARAAVRLARWGAAAWGAWAEPRMATEPYVRRLCAVLLDAVTDKDPRVQEQVCAALHGLGESRPEDMLSACEGHLRQHEKLAPPCRTRILQAMETVLRSRLDELDKDTVRALVLLAANEMTRVKLGFGVQELVSDWQQAASSVLVAVGRRFVGLVMEELLTRFQPGALPHCFVVRTLADLSVSNVLGTVPFLTSILSTMLPMLGWAKHDSTRVVFCYGELPAAVCRVRGAGPGPAPVATLKALLPPLGPSCSGARSPRASAARAAPPVCIFEGPVCCGPPTATPTDLPRGAAGRVVSTILGAWLASDRPGAHRRPAAVQRFSESALEYLASLDQAPDPTVRKDSFAADISDIYEVLFHHWLQSREAKLRLAVVQALGPMSQLLPSEKLEEQLPKLLPGVLALYKKHAEALPVSQSLGQILEAAVGISSRTLEPQLDSLLAALHAQVGGPDLPLATTGIRDTWKVSGTRSGSPVPDPPPRGAPRGASAGPIAPADQLSCRGCATSGPGAGQGVSWVPSGLGGDRRPVGAWAAAASALTALCAGGPCGTRCGSARRRPQVCVPVETLSPLALSNQKEVLRCLTALACCSPDRLLGFLLPKLGANDERTRVGSLQILRHVINSAPARMEAKKPFVLASLRLPLLDSSDKASRRLGGWAGATAALQVKRAVVQVVSAMAHHGYLEQPGGEAMVEYIVRQCALPAQPEAEVRAPRARPRRGCRFGSWVAVAFSRMGLAAPAHRPPHGPGSAPAASRLPGLQTSVGLCACGCLAGYFPAGVRDVSCGLPTGVRLRKRQQEVVDSQLLGMKVPGAVSSVSSAPAHLSALAEWCSGRCRPCPRGASALGSRQALCVLVAQSPEWRLSGLPGRGAGLFTELAGVRTKGRARPTLRLRWAAGVAVALWSEPDSPVGVLILHVVAVVSWGSGLPPGSQRRAWPPPWHPQPGPDGETPAEDSVRSVSVSTLYLVSTTVDRMGDVLWPYLLEFLTPVGFTGALTPLCRSLLHLAQKRQQEQPHGCLVDYCARGGCSEPRPACAPAPPPPPRGPAPPRRPRPRLCPSPPVRALPQGRPAGSGAAEPLLLSSDPPVSLCHNRQASAPRPALQTVSCDPYAGDGRGPASLRLLRVLHGSVHPLLGQRWETTIPLLLEHLDGEARAVPATLGWPGERGLWTGREPPGPRPGLDVAGQAWPPEARAPGVGTPWCLASCLCGRAGGRCRFRAHGGVPAAGGVGGEAADGERGARRGGPGRGQAAHGAPHPQFLQDTLATVADNTWTCQLSLEMCKQLPSYDGAPQEKSFLYRCIGTVLGAASDGEVVRKCLQELLDTARHREGAEQEGLACCFGICAASHLDDTLAQLEDCVQAEVFRKSAGIFSLFKERSETEAERVRSTLILCYGQVAAQAPCELVLARLEADILRNMFLCFHTKVLGVKVESKDPALKLCLVRSVCAASRAVSSSAQAGAFHFAQKVELVAQMLVSVQSCGVHQGRASGLPEDARSDEGYARLLPPGVSAWPAAAGSTGGHEGPRLLNRLALDLLLSPLEPALEEPLRAGLIRGCLHSVLAVQPGPEGPGDREALLQDTMQALGHLLAGLLHRNVTPQGLQVMVEHLSPWIKSPRGHERARALGLSAHLLRHFLEHLHVSALVPFHNLGLLVGLFSPRCADLCLAGRQEALSCVHTLLYVQLGYEGFSRDHQDEVAEQLLALREGLVHPDPTTLFHTCHSVAQVVARRLPPDQLIGLLLTLFEGLGDLDGNCSRAASVMVGCLLKERGHMLLDKVQAPPGGAGRPEVVGWVPEPWPLQGPSGCCGQCPRPRLVMRAAGHCPCSWPSLGAPVPPLRLLLRDRAPGPRVSPGGQRPPGHVLGPLAVLWPAAEVPGLCVGPGPGRDAPDTRSQRPDGPLRSACSCPAPRDGAAPNAYPGSLGTLEPLLPAAGQGVEPAGACLGLCGGDLLTGRLRQGQWPGWEPHPPCPSSLGLGQRHGLSVWSAVALPGWDRALTPSSRPGASPERQCRPLQVPEVVSVLRCRLQETPAEHVLQAARHSVHLLATQHHAAVVSSLLGSPLPFDRYCRPAGLRRPLLCLAGGWALPALPLPVQAQGSSERGTSGGDAPAPSSHSCMLWRALAAEPSLTARVLGLLLDKMGCDVPFKESRTFLLSSSPERVATLLPLAATCALRELLAAPESSPAVLELYPRLFAALLLRISCTLDVQLPRSLQAKEKERRGPGPAPPSLEPCSPAQGLAACPLQPNSPQAVGQLLGSLGHTNLLLLPPSLEGATVCPLQPRAVSCASTRSALGLGIHRLGGTQGLCRDLCVRLAGALQPGCLGTGWAGLCPLLGYCPNQGHRDLFGGLLWNIFTYPPKLRATRRPGPGLGPLAGTVLCLSPSSAVAALQAVLLRGGSEDVVHCVELEGGWELLRMSAGHEQGVALLARAMAKLAGPRLPATVRALLCAQSSVYEVQRVTATAFLAELLSSKVADDLMLLDLLLDTLLARQKDTSPRVRCLVLRGLANVASSSREQVPAHSPRLLTAMIAGLDDGDDPHSLVALEAMVGLARLLGLLDSRELRSVLLHVAIRIRPFFDSEKTEFRAASIQLFGRLNEVCGADCEDDVFLEQAVGGLAPLLLHLQDPQAPVAEACRYALRTCAPCLQCEELSAAFQKHLQEGRRLHFGEFLNTTCKHLMQRFPELLGRLASTSLFYFKSAWEDLRAAAPLLTGCLVLHAEPEQRTQVDLEQLLAALQLLLRDPAPAVRARAAETLGRLVRFA